MSFFGELRSRNVFRVGIAYLAVVWLLLQVADLVVPILDAPPWLLRALFFSSVLGFPLALVLAWFYELTPDGLKVASEMEAIESAGFTGRKLDFAIIAVLVLAVGFLLVRSPLGNQATVLPNSVAVLPFENLSPDPDDAYFAAGIHEEVLNQLAKLRSMNVISRNSVTRYVDSDLTIPEIANELHVETVMEGSVRFAEDRVLVTAQLIDPQTDVHLWSESYNRDFADVFAIQADIAMNIANALEAELSLEEQERIEKKATDVPAAYALYLQSLVPGSSQLLILDEAIELDPSFALAHARKAYLGSFRVRGIAPGFSTTPEEAAEILRTSFESARLALALDPALGLAHAALGLLYMAEGRGVEAEEAFQRAVELSPNDAVVFSGYGTFKRIQGEYDEAIRLGERAVQLNPHAYGPHNQLGLAYRSAGDYDAAAIQLQFVQDLYPTNDGNLMNLVGVEIARGNDDEALKQLEVLKELAPGPRRVAQMVAAYQQLGRHEDALEMFSVFETSAVENPVGDAVWANVYVELGEYELALPRLRSAVNNQDPTDLGTLRRFARNPLRDPILDEPEWRELRNRIQALE